MTRWWIRATRQEATKRTSQSLLDIAHLLVIALQAILAIKIGQPFARKYLSQLNYVKDMHISIEKFPPILVWRKEPRFKLLLSKIILWLTQIRNYQPYGIYCSLNIGVSGLVKDQYSLEYLKNKHQIGDILTLTVDEDYTS